MEFVVSHLDGQGERKPYRAAKTIFEEKYLPRPVWLISSGESVLEISIMLMSFFPAYTSHMLNVYNFCSRT